MSRVFAVVVVVSSTVTPPGRRRRRARCSRARATRRGPTARVAGVEFVVGHDVARAPNMSTRDVERDAARLVRVRGRWYRDASASASRVASVTREERARERRERRMFSRLAARCRFSTRGRRRRRRGRGRARGGDGGGRRRRRDAVSAARARGRNWRRRSRASSRGRYDPRGRGISTAWCVCDSFLSVFFASLCVFSRTLGSVCVFALEWRLTRAAAKFRARRRRRTCARRRASIGRGMPSFAISKRRRRRIRTRRDGIARSSPCPRPGSARNRTRARRRGRAFVSASAERLR